MLVPLDPKSVKDKNDYLTISIDWKDVIEEVRCEHSCTYIEFNLLSDVLHQTIAPEENEDEWEKNPCYPKRYNIYEAK